MASPTSKIIIIRKCISLLLVFAFLLLFVPAWADDEGHGKWADWDPPTTGTGLTGAIVHPGDDGKAHGFPARNTALLSWLTSEDLSGQVQYSSDVWGFTSASGREYAIIGLERGTSFVDVTDPVNPVVLPLIPGIKSVWRDFKTYGNYAYSITDIPGEQGVVGPGMLVIDISKIDDRQLTVTSILKEQGLERAHTMVVNPESGYLYLNGSNLHHGGLVAVDVRDPANPHVAEAWNGHYVHDSLVVNYHEGPWAGREIAFCACTVSGLKILDVTDKTSITLLSQHAYPEVTYAHDVTLSEDRRFLFLNDELDELGSPQINTTTTHYYNVEDLAHPVYSGWFTNGNPAVDHNPMVRGDYIYEANYRSGLRVYNIANPAGAWEVAYFDTHPENDVQNLGGAWGVYPLLPSGNVLISDIERGLFVLKHFIQDNPNDARNWDLFN